MILDARPDLGSVLGVGSANTVFALDRAPELVLRVRHTMDSMSLNLPDQEIALWRSAAALNLAPKVIWAGQNKDVVITQRLDFDNFDERAHSQLLRSIHDSGIAASPLSLEKTAHSYREVIDVKGLGHLAMGITKPEVLNDLRMLDSEPACFCHNDLTPSNIGRLEKQHLAIDWEYASLGSRHFDIAVASQNMDPASRDKFARDTADRFFDPLRWRAAIRVASLFNHLWGLAVLGKTGDREDKRTVEKAWD